MKNHETLVWIPSKNSASGAPPPSHSMTWESGHNICISRAKLVILSFSSSYDASTVTDCYIGVLTSVLNHLTHSRNPREESKCVLSFRSVAFVLLALSAFSLAFRLHFWVTFALLAFSLPFQLSSHFPVCLFAKSIAFPLSTFLS